MPMPTLSLQPRRDINASYPIPRGTSSEIKFNASCKSHSSSNKILEQPPYPNSIDLDIYSYFAKPRIIVDDSLHQVDPNGEDTSISPMIMSGGSHWMSYLPPNEIVEQPPYTNSIDSNISSHLVGSHIPTLTSIPSPPSETISGESVRRITRNGEGTSVSEQPPSPRGVLVYPLGRNPHSPYPPSCS